MGLHSPRTPCSALFLLLLLLPPPIFRAGNLQHHGSNWKIFHRMGKDFRNFHHHQDEVWHHFRQGQTRVNCQGIFDLFFILDKSGSVDNNWMYIYSFVEKLVTKFQNPKLRMSFITYSTDADIILPLTSDRSKIRNGLNRLRKVVPEGHTYMQQGFIKANEQIQSAHSGGSRVNSVIIALTDGKLDMMAYHETLDEAAKARKMGATVYTVGVFEYDKRQMLDIADSPQHSFGVDNGFTALQDIIDSLVSKSCIEVLSVDPSPMPPTPVAHPQVSTTESASRGNDFPGAPSHVCIKGVLAYKLDPLWDLCPTEEGDTENPRPPSPTGDSSANPSPESYEVDITGHGFGNTHDRNHVFCRFTFSDSRIIDEKPISMTDSTIICPGPKIEKTTQEILLEVSLNNGISFIGNSLKITGTNCGGGDTFNWNLLLFLPALLLLLSLLWCCWKLCFRKSKNLPSPPEPEKEPEEENLPPPPPIPPPPPPPISTNPTVIVACCGCGNRNMQGNMESCCNYFHPNCHQMPLMWCHPKQVQGRCSNFTVLKPNCAQVSCRPKICLQPNRDCFHLSQQACSSQILLQPSGECFRIPQSPCPTNICLRTNQECFPVAQTLGPSKTCPQPNQECYSLGTCSPCNRPPSGCTVSPSRMLPLLPPHARQSIESLGRAHLRHPTSKRLKF